MTFRMSQDMLCIQGAGGMFGQVYRYLNILSEMEGEWGREKLSDVVAAR